MKIGIFGDSFAADNKMNPTNSWVDILRNDHEIENHSLPSTNLYYSILKIKEHYKKYEKIIFVVTQPSRIKISDSVPCPDPTRRYVAHWPNIKYLINDANRNNIHDGPLIDAYNTALNYYKYIQDNVYDEYIHKLMLDDIVRMSSNIMLIPAFPDSIPGKQVCSLIKIREKENLAWGYGYFIPTDFNDERNCHLTEENNLILARKILDSINSDFLDLNLDDFVTPLNKEFYIKKYE
jgi:hypothetical protein